MALNIYKTQNGFLCITEGFDLMGGRSFDSVFASGYTFHSITEALQFTRTWMESPSRNLPDVPTSGVIANPPRRSVLSPETYADLINPPEILAVSGAAERMDRIIRDHLNHLPIRPPEVVPPSPTEILLPEEYTDEISDRREEERDTPEDSEPTTSAV